MATTHQNCAEDTGKLVLRLGLGVLILLHGISKITGDASFIFDLIAKTGLPQAFGYLVYVGEVIAPLLIIVGLWTRVAAIVVAINMIVAVVLVHMNQIFAISNSGGWELELQGMYLFTAVAVALLGAGRISISGTNGRWN